MVLCLRMLRSVKGWNRRLYWNSSRISSQCLPGARAVLTMLHLTSFAHGCERVRLLEIDNLKHATSILTNWSFEAVINNPDRKRKLTNFGPTACFTNTVLQTGALPKRVRASHRRRMPVALTALQMSAVHSMRWSIVKFWHGARKVPLQHNTMGW